jgi:hypothetical protein
MIFLRVVNFTGVLVPSFNLNEKACLEKLKISHWSYTNFVISAMLFCIKHELTQGVSSFYILSKDVVYLLFNETTLGDEVFRVLKFTNLFTLYRDDALDAINQFFYQMI